MKKLEKFKDKSILILGFGKEGISSLNFFRRIFPKKVIGIGDRKDIKNLKPKIKNLLKKDKRLKLHFGKDYLKTLKNYDIIVKSPGIPPKVIKPFLKKKSSFAKSYGGRGQKITSQTEIFFENCPGKIIGVTGTKGKSTTSSLIYKVLKDNGLKVNLIGNIGKPALSFLLTAKPDNIYVFELSSHQLLGLRKSPQIAVLLNIFPEHLDYYKNFKDYVKAKTNIVKYQSKKDFLIFNSENKIVNKIVKKSKAKKLPLKSVKIKKIESALKGDFNLQKLKAVILVGRIFDLEDKEILKAIKEFKPLPHRLEYVGTFRGIKFYNDALSTIPETTIAALDTLGNNVQTIFLGGLDRGISFTNLAKRLLQSKIKNLILFHTTGERIWEETLRLSKKNTYKAFLVSNMRDGVKMAYKFTQKGKICLLSTASPSFTLFKDYKEKGNLFKKYVKRYGKSN